MINQQSLHETNKKLKKALERKICMQGEYTNDKCEGDFVSAHTVSKSNTLKKIAKKQNNNGDYLYTINTSLLGLNNNGGLVFDKVSIKKASTLNMFCKKHDNKLFACFEKDEFAYSDEQIAMISYRTLCKELYIKKQQLKGDYTPTNDEFSKFIKEYNIEGYKRSVKDLESESIIFNKMIDKKDFSRIRYYCLTIDKNPEIAVSGGILPEYDFDGNLLNNINDYSKDLFGLYINVINIGNQGVIIFSWIDLADEYCTKFISSLQKLSNEDKIAAIVNFIFCCHENVFCSIDWYDELSDKYKISITNSINLINRHEFIQDYKEYVGIVDWKIIEEKPKLN